MRTIALTFADPEFLDRLHDAFPEAELVHVRLDQVAGIAAQRSVSALILDEDALGQTGPAAVAIIGASFPALAIVGLLRVPPSSSNALWALCQARVNGVLMAGVDDHRDTVRELFRRAATNSVGSVMEYCCQPAPAPLVAPNLMGSLDSLGKLQGAKAFASTLGRPLHVLRDELRRAELPPPRSMLSSLRILAAARLLGDTNDGPKRIARIVGYGSAVSLFNACHHSLGATPEEIRAEGGLWLAGARFRAAVASYRRSRVA